LASSLFSSGSLSLLGCYNEFVERLPQYSGFHWWEPFGIGPVLITTGWYWLRSLGEKRVTDDVRADL